MLHYLTVSVNRILKQPSNSVLLASGGNVLTASRAALQIYATSRLHVAGGVVTEYSASPWCAQLFRFPMKCLYLVTWNVSWFRNLCISCKHSGPALAGYHRVKFYSASFVKRGTLSWSVWFEKKGEWNKLRKLPRHCRKHLNLIQQLFNSHLLEMRLVDIANSGATRLVTISCLTRSHDLVTVR